MSNAELLMEEIKTLPAGRVAEVLDFVEFIKQKETRSAKEENDDSWFEKGEECPICAKHRDPKTGELRFNAETMAAIEEGDAMLRGEIPTKWYNSLEEMMVDLDAD
jgi:hypothetical protein